MCGIIGYVGAREAVPVLINGLSRLEYRGYDSAGISVMNNGTMHTRKAKGRLSNLQNLLEVKKVNGTMGIGHTRWATHGEPSDVNSHPHKSFFGGVTVVHNGIIENYVELKEMLMKAGFEFKSSTDTEVIPNLIEYYYNGDLLLAVQEATKMLKGSYAIGVMCEEEPGKLIAVRKDSPLIVGLGKGEFFIASDIPAILEYTRDIYLLEDKEYAIIDEDKVVVVDELGQTINKDIYHVEWDIESSQKGDFDHFMIKEIFEQPKVIKDTISSKVKDENSVFFDKTIISKEMLEETDRIFIVACGTAYHAGLIGKNYIESLAKIPVEVDIASEFRYRNPLITNKSLVIVISQSGETADTLAVLRDAKNIGAKVIAITNVVGSSAAREADEVIFTLAGPEIAVASTKAYITQIVALYNLAIYIGRLLGNITAEEEAELIKELKLIPEKVKEILKNTEEIKSLANILKDYDNIFFLGRGIDYAVALEGALKLKEVSYINCQAYAGGELKHGPIALIEEGTIVVTSLTQGELNEKMLSNIKEVTTRGAKVLAISEEGEKIDGVDEDMIIRIPKSTKLLSPLLTVVPMQLLAYYVAVYKGCDVDKPKNLAKSVTVE